MSSWPRFLFYGPATVFLVILAAVGTYPLLSRAVRPPFHIHAIRCFLGWSLTGVPGPLAILALVLGDWRRG